MMSRSTRTFFVELGITQSFYRAGPPPTTSRQRAGWMATLKCERLYDADTASMTPDEVHSMIERFIGHYNDVRLHQGLGSPDCAQTWGLLTPCSRGVDTERR
jgi:hypothetical protein